MVSLTLDWSWSRGVLADGECGGRVALYFVLDRFKQRT